MAPITAALSVELLSLQREIFNFYLEPLLKIHNDANNNIVTYEDLTASFQAAVASLGGTNTTNASIMKHMQNVDANGKNVVVRACSYTLEYSSIDFLRRYVLDTSHAIKQLTLVYDNCF
jgi:hypothetical protein